MPRLLRKLTNLVLLSALLILQTHVLFDKHDEAGQPDDDCTLCSQVLSTVVTAPVTLPALEAVLLPFSFKAPCQPKAVCLESAAFPALRGPPANSLV